MIWDVLVVLAVALSSSVYATGALRLRRHHTLRVWPALTFFAGQATLLVALVSPLDTLADLLFSAHMAQHELLMLIAAPLLIVGRPLTTMLAALPAPARRRVGTLVRAPLTRATWRTVTGPLTVLVAHAFVVWIWHVPALFEAAMRDDAIHAFQHASMLGTAALFWWAVVHGRYGRAGYGVSVLYVFATALNQTILGALITVARVLWYPIYEGRAEQQGWAALEDQQLAGLLMWVPTGVVFAVIALALFAAWIGESERRSAANDAALARVSGAP